MPKITNIISAVRENIDPKPSTEIHIGAVALSKQWLAHRKPANIPMRSMFCLSRVIGLSDIYFTLSNKTYLNKKVPIC